VTAHRPELVDAVRVVREVLADVNPGRASDDARLHAEIDVDVLFVVAASVYVVKLFVIELFEVRHADSDCSGDATYDRTRSCECDGDSTIVERRQRSADPSG
jgi:hypothetical protein